MKIPFSMLQDFVQTKLTAEQVGDLLTMAGFELEGLETVEGQPVLDVKVMSNRGDGLSALGLAREILAKDDSSKPTELYLRAIKGFEGAVWPAAGSGLVKIESPECNRFCALTIDGVRNGQSADWMQARLRQAGLRCISLIVDLSNYIMLELGQPTHAFDRAKLTEGRIVLRASKPGEKLTTLNGDEHELPAGTMMVCDAARPVGVPGVMGGLDTEVSDGTTQILLESAHFDSNTVRKTRKNLGLNTDASYRFERSVDPEGAPRAARRFVELLAQVNSDFKVTGLADEYPGKPKQRQIQARVERASRLLGMAVTTDQAESYLSRLGFQVVRNGDILTTTAPTWRQDVVREEDVIEEIGRVHGYGKVPETLPKGQTVQGGSFGFEAFVDGVRGAALRSGLIQIMSHTLRDAGPLDEPGDQITVRNPASPDAAYLRNSLLPCLADAARRNGGEALHLFENGRCFVAEKGERREEVRLGILSVGALQPGHWTKTEPGTADFFSMKGVVEAITSEAGVDVKFVVPKQPDPRFHPTRQSEVMVGPQVAGVMGQIHPDVAENAEISAETVMAELGLGTLFGGRTEAALSHAISRNPAVRRDISALIDKSVPYEKVACAVAEAVGPELEKQWLFDVYAGKGIPEGKHSITIALQLRKLGANFTDEEANQVRDRAVRALESLGATQR